MKNNDLENIKRLKNLLEFLPDNKKKEMVILEYNFYKQFLLETGCLDNDSLINENEEILAKQWELLRKTNNYVYVLSDVIANNLILRYFSDKKKGLIEIKKFITTMHQYSVLENLQRYGFDLKATEDEVKMLYNYQKKKFYL